MWIEGTSSAMAVQLKALAEASPRPRLLRPPARREAGTRPPSELTGFTPPLRRIEDAPAEELSMNRQLFRSS